MQQTWWKASPDEPVDVLGKILMAISRQMETPKPNDLRLSLSQAVEKSSHCGAARKKAKLRLEVQMQPIHRLNSTSL